MPWPKQPELGHFWSLRGNFGHRIQIGSPSTRQVAPGWTHPSWNLPQKSVQLQADPSGTTRISGCISIPGKTQSLPGESPEQPGVGSELALLGVGPPGVPSSLNHPAAPRSGADGKVSTRNLGSASGVSGFFFLRQSRAISCSIIRLVKTRP